MGLRGSALCQSLNMAFREEAGTSKFDLAKVADCSVLEDVFLSAARSCKCCGEIRKVQP